MVTLITRPQAEALFLQQKLYDMKFNSVIESMFTVVSLAIDIVALERMFVTNKLQLIVFTSINSIKIFAKLTNIRNILVLTVGKVTAMHAKSLGFEHVITVDKDATEIVTYIRKNFVSSEVMIVYPHGKTISVDIVSILREDNFDVRDIVIYDVLPIQSLSENVIEMINSKYITSVLFFSAETARIFGILAKQAGIVLRLNSVISLSLSSKIASVLEWVPWKNSYVSSIPTEDALLKLLCEKL
ncbi:MAG: uroporphyrinogen-III synthase [Rickettsiales endosymbiont of Dermacentor nuttalli]